MVSSGDKRNAKYLAKYDATTVGVRYGLVKDIATGAFAATANTMAMYETQVKNDILAVITPAVPAYQIAAYLAFMRQCFKRFRKYSGATLVLEVQGIANSWSAKGLDPTGLMAIAALFGATIASPH
jgi:hypothetical protein